jgi:hypothetical protein
LNEEWLEINIPAYETPATIGWYINNNYTSSFTVFTFKVKEGSSEREVNLDSVEGHWKSPEGKWGVKPPFHNPF